MARSQWSEKRDREPLAVRATGERNGILRRVGEINVEGNLGAAGKKANSTLSLSSLSEKAVVIPWQR
jgi:hypothetical protein